MTYYDIDPNKVIESRILDWDLKEYIPAQDVMIRFKHGCYKLIMPNWINYQHLTVYSKMWFSKYEVLQWLQSVNNGNIV